MPTRRQTGTRLAEAFRAGRGASDYRAPDAGIRAPRPARALIETGTKAHTRDAPPDRAAGRAVRRARPADPGANPRDGIGELRPLDPAVPAEWGGGTILPDDRDLRDAWPEGVTLPRAINFNLACTTLGLPAVVSDLSTLDRRAALLLQRYAPGYREIIASELPHFVKRSCRARVRPQPRRHDREAVPARRGGAVGRRRKPQGLVGPPACSR